VGDFVKFFGLYDGKTKEGKQMLSGFLGSAKIVILPNRDKVDEKDHDFIAFITQRPPKKE
jgi:hypothetical protein